MIQEWPERMDQCYMVIRKKGQSSGNPRFTLKVSETDTGTYFT
jgi:hypothetical protein